MDVKHGVLVLSLFEEREMLGWVSVFLNEFGYDSFNTGVQTGFLTEGRNELCYSSMCSVDRSALLAEKRVVRVIK